MEHDNVINYIKRTLSPDYNVLVNLGEQKQWHVSGVFPDIILTPKDSNNILFIIEIETSNTVNSIMQWKNYQNLPGTLYVVVPTANLNDAKSIAAIAGIKAKFGHYDYRKNPDGSFNINVIYEP